MRACSRTRTSTASVAIAGSATVALMMVCSAHILRLIDKERPSCGSVQKIFWETVSLRAQRQRGFRAELHGGEVTGEELGIRGGGDHGGVVGRKRPRREIHRHAGFRSFGL